MQSRLLTLDEGPTGRNASGRRKRPEPFNASALRAATQYALQLRKLASQVKNIVGGFDTIDLPTAERIRGILDRYAEILEPWAIATANRMLKDVDVRNQRAWMLHAEQMSVGMRQTIRKSPVGQTLRELLAEQVGLIKSIPIEAAQRVHKLTLAGLEDSTRFTEIAAEIARSGEVAASRATLIARTEVARTAAKLTEARSRHIGSVGYIWRTAGDQTVRPSHKAMAGRMVEWNQPPTLDGMTGHAGCFPNCRCWCDPVLPDEFD